MATAACKAGRVMCLSEATGLSRLFMAGQAASEERSSPLPAASALPHIDGASLPLVVAQELLALNFERGDPLVGTGAGQGTCLLAVGCWDVLCLDCNTQGLRLDLQSRA